MILPPAIRPLVAFPALLRQNGFAVAPEQTTSFLMATELLGPRSVEHLRRAAVATLAPHPEQRARFDALFDAHFLGALAEPGEEEWAPNEEMSVQEDSGTREILVGEEVNESGRAATDAEALSVRRLRLPDDSDTLRRFGRDLPAALPRRRGYRHGRARRGPTIDLARSLKDAIRHDGEVMSLKRLRRRSRPRPLLLLIDVSGSMKERTDAHLALAHTVVGAAPRAEVFTLGTRLTRLTGALRRRNRQQALSEAAGLVADWDGGTRIGDALGAFLAVPRYASFARGAVVVVLSDGLERGDPAALIAAMHRLAARAHRIDWLSPLAGDPEYRPETQVLRAIRPLIASLADGSSTARACRHILSLGGGKAA
ncbi:vWA domain-containing protein [Enterovirga sp. CN4-39]|uniref:vWA domain-containing protein n=1 Tax=Enterovirga sp. CN4-39 TaxID=3400910 RepID=UPI003C101658